jgi:hypothetical protein
MIVPTTVLITTAVVVMTAVNMKECSEDGVLRDATKVPGPLLTVSLKIPQRGKRMRMENH